MQLKKDIWDRWPLSLFQGAKTKFKRELHLLGADWDWITKEIRFDMVEAGISEEVYTHSTWTDRNVYINPDDWGTTYVGPIYMG